MKIHNVKTDDSTQSRLHLQTTGSHDDGNQGDQAVCKHAHEMVDTQNRGDKNTCGIKQNGGQPEFETSTCIQDQHTMENMQTHGQEDITQQVDTTWQTNDNQHLLEMQTPDELMWQERQHNTEFMFKRYNIMRPHEMEHATLNMARNQHSQASLG